MSSQGKKRLEGMRRNPRDDWRIEDVEVVCRAYSVDCLKPKNGSHYVISHPTQAEILTIPFNRPIKAIYIKLLVGFIKGVEDAS